MNKKSGTATNTSLEATSNVFCTSNVKTRFWMMSWPGVK